MLGKAMLKRPDCMEGLYWQGAVACILEMCLSVATIQTTPDNYINQNFAFDPANWHEMPGLLFV